MYYVVHTACLIAVYSCSFKYYGLHSLVNVQYCCVESVTPNIIYQTITVIIPILSGTCTRLHLNSFLAR